MQYNLDLSQYSFGELLDLFELNPDTVTIYDLNKAKRKVLFMHPDKSGLDPEYFLFFKKAYDIVYEMYGHIQKINQKLPEESPEYQVQKENITFFQKNDETFQKKFNKLFEENMIKKNKRSNDWFSDPNTPLFTSIGTVNDSIESLKDSQQNLVKYNGVQMIHSNNGSSFYDDEEEGYVESNLFSKLKFEDLRKVHKDQTIFNGVRQKDFYNFHNKNTTVEEYKLHRSQLPTPLSKHESEQILERQNAIEKHKMIEKQHIAQLQSMDFEERNKKVMAHFLHLH